MFSVVCTDSWSSEIVFEGGSVLASSSKDGGAPWIADGSRVGWSGVPILGPRDISPSASRLASEEDPARVENQESLALCCWSTIPVSCSGGDGCVPRCCALCRDVVCCAEMSRPVCECRDVVSYAEMWCVMPRCCVLCRDVVSYAEMLCVMPRCCVLCRDVSTCVCMLRCCVLCRDVVCYAEMSRPVCACRDVVSYADMLCVMPRCLDLCVHAEICGPVSRVSCADMSLFPSTCTCANVSLLKSLFQF